MKRRTRFVHGLILLAIFLIGFGPLLLALTAGAFASINGCTLHEGFVNPCVVMGIDFGERLYAMGVMAWITLVSLPVAFVMLGIYLTVVFVLWLRGKRKNDIAS